MRTRPEDTELLSFRDLLVRFIASLLHGVCVCAVYQVETDLHAAHALELNIDFENRVREYWLMFSNIFVLHSQQYLTQLCSTVTVQHLIEQQHHVGCL